MGKPGTEVPGVLGKRNRVPKGRHFYPNASFESNAIPDFRIIVSNSASCDRFL